MKMKKSKCSHCGQDYLISESHHHICNGKITDWFESLDKLIKRSGKHAKKNPASYYGGML